MSISLLAENSVVFLLGAGCSIDAGVPMANRMVENLDSEIGTQSSDIRDIYYYLKSAILFSANIKGNFGNTFSIEVLMCVIEELLKKEDHLIFNYTNGWNLQFYRLAGDDFKNLHSLQQFVNNKLIEWISPKEGYTNEYYKGFVEFQLKYQYAVRVFSLNYDLCFEGINIDPTAIVDGFGQSKEWDQNLFVSNEIDSDVKFYLYKIHGSINWYKDNSKPIVRKAVNSVVRKQELIFGTATKLRSRNPYLFYMYEFSRWLHNNACRAIVVIGYSFSDDHINDVITESILEDTKRKLIIVDPYGNKQFFAERLKISEDNILVVKEKAQYFLEHDAFTTISTTLDNNIELPF